DVAPRLAGKLARTVASTPQPASGHGRHGPCALACRDSPCLRAHPHGAGPTRPFADARVRRRPRRRRADRRSGGARARARQARTPGRSVLGGDPSARPPHSGALVAQDASPDRKPNPPPPGPGHGSHDPDPPPCRLPDRKDTAGRDTASVPSPWALLVGLQGSWIAQENGDLSEGISSREGWISGPSPPPLAPAKAFSRSGRGRIFSLYSRVMREGLSTGHGARWLGSGLSGPTFSGPDDCADLVNSRPSP